MLQYLENFLIVATTVDIYKYHKKVIETLQALIKNKSFFYKFQEVLEKLIIDIFQEVSLRSKTVNFMKMYYRKIISLSYELWINPFILTSPDVNNDLKVRTITNFTNLIQLVKNEIEIIEKSETWISIQNDTNIKAQQNICKSIMLDEIFMIYLEAIQTPANQSLTNNNRQQIISIHNRKNEVEKWKVEILSNCNQNINDKKRSGYKQEHYDYLSKRFPSKTLSGTSHAKNCATHRATLYFHKNPLHLDEMDTPEINSLPILSVREFNEKKHLSVNGDPNALYFDILINKMNISVENIRHIYIYGLSIKNNSRRFVGFAFQNKNHFDMILRQKRFR